MEASESSSRVSWGPEPQYRGTFSLIISSLTTLVFCISTAIHLDVCPKAKGKQRLCLKIFWMLFAFISPPTLLLYASTQWGVAVKIHRDLQEVTNMGGVEEGDRLDMNWAFFLLSGGFVYEDNGKLIGIEAESFTQLLSEGAIKNLAQASVDLKDRSKADYFTKSIVLAQVSYTFVQFIARFFSGLPISLLEVHVIIQALFGAAMYSFWWRKTFDASGTVKLEVSESARLSLNKKVESERELSDMAVFLDVHQEPKRSTFDIFRLYYNPEEPIRGTDVGFTQKLYLSFGLVYIGLHAAAWNADFPSQVECWMWRGACVGLLIGAVMMYISVRYLGWVGINILEPVLYVVMLFLDGYLIVESLISLRSVPPDLFKVVQWTNYFPHL